jgi:hypothetical protein
MCADLFSKLLSHMTNSGKRVPIDHPRPRIPHDFLNLIPVIFIVAMNFTLVACNFPFIKWTFIEARHRVIQEVKAVVAQVM